MPPSRLWAKEIGEMLFAFVAEYALCRLAPANCTRPPVRHGFTQNEPGVNNGLTHGSLFCMFNLKNKVGATGFEPTTPCSQSRCANRTALRPEYLPSLYSGKGFFVSGGKDSAKQRQRKEKAVGFFFALLRCSGEAADKVMRHRLESLSTSAKTGSCGNR